MGKEGKFDAVIPKVDQITANFIQLLPLVYTKLNNLLTQNMPSPKKQTDLTHLQQHILDELFNAQPGFSMTQLALRVNISKQQLTPVIAKLEEKGYVTKGPDASDKRSVNLVLSDKGKKTVTGRWEEVHHALANRLAKLSEEELVDLEYAITKIVRILGKLE